MKKFLINLYAGVCKCGKGVFIGCVAVMFTVMVAMAQFLLMIATIPVAIVEGILFVPWALLLPTSAAKCLERWGKREGCAGTFDSILFLANDTDFKWHYPIAFEVFHLCVNLVKKIYLPNKVVFMEICGNITDYSVDDQIKWYEKYHDGDFSALRRISRSAFMKIWTDESWFNISKSESEKIAVAMGQELPYEAVESMMSWEKPNWGIISKWYLSQSRSNNVLNTLFERALAAETNHPSVNIAKSLIRKNGLPQNYVAYLVSKQNQVSKMLLKANEDYELIILLRSSDGRNRLTQVINTLKSMDPDFNGFSPEVERYLNYHTYSIYNAAGCPLKLETLKWILSSDKVDGSLLRAIIGKEAMFKDLSSLDEDLKVLFRSKIEYLNNL